MKVRVNMKVRVMVKHICFRMRCPTFTYFHNCDKCIPAKNRQKILLGKCDVLHLCKDQIVDYYGCDKCCKFNITVLR